MVVKSKTNPENSAIKTILSSLSELIYDQNTPQNVKNSVLSISKILSNGNGTIEQRKNHAMQLLEEIVSDINLDACTRTTLFSTISLVESLSGEKIEKSGLQNIYK